LQSRVSNVAKPIDTNADRMPCRPISNGSKQSAVACAANPDRWMRSANRAGTGMYFGKRDEAAVKACHVVHPTDLHRFEILIGDGAAMLEVDVQRGELLLRPADANAEDKAAAAEHIDVGNQTRRLQRVTIWHDRDCGSQFDAR